MGVCDNGMLVYSKMLWGSSLATLEEYCAKKQTSLPFE